MMFRVKLAPMGLYIQPMPSRANVIIAICSNVRRFSPKIFALNPWGPVYRSTKEACFVVKPTPKINSATPQPPPTPTHLVSLSIAYLPRVFSRAHLSLFQRFLDHLKAHDEYFTVTIRLN